MPNADAERQSPANAETVNVLQSLWAPSSKLSRSEVISTFNSILCVDVSPAAAMPRVSKSSGASQTQPLQAPPANSPVVPPAAPPPRPAATSDCAPTPVTQCEEPTRLRTRPKKPPPPFPPELERPPAAATTDVPYKLPPAAPPPGRPPHPDEAPPALVKTPPPSIGCTTKSRSTPFEQPVTPVSKTPPPPPPPICVPPAAGARPPPPPAKRAGTSSDGDGANRAKAARSDAGAGADGAQRVSFNGYVTVVPESLAAPDPEAVPAWHSAAGSSSSGAGAGADQSDRASTPAWQQGQSDRASTPAMDVSLPIVLRPGDITMHTANNMTRNHAHTTLKRLRKEMADEDRLDASCVLAKSCHRIWVFQSSFEFTNTGCIYKFTCRIHKFIFEFTHLLPVFAHRLCVILIVFARFGFTNSIVEFTNPALNLQVQAEFTNPLSN